MCNALSKQRNDLMTKTFVTKRFTDLVSR
jgi:hypothetical protein